MLRCEVYLEIGLGGECMAHPPALPGCVTRAAGREAALAALPAAVGEHLAWLRHHGEPAPDLPAVPRFEVVGVSSGYGPFSRGDRAALFPPDRTPLGRDELEVYIRLGGYARADLLALVGDLAAETLDWRRGAKAMSIRQILRHVGNAEQWYVSRLVDPETLPPEWDHDDVLPLDEFLAMERRTATERLRQLTDRELAAVAYPARWTGHPDEPWTARKALRRLLEHELEHTRHVRAVLAARRARAVPSETP